MIFLYLKFLWIKLIIHNIVANRATIDGRDIILVYGNAGELHETAIKFKTSTAPAVKVLSGSSTVKQKVLNGGALALQYSTLGQTVVQVGSNTLIYILGNVRHVQHGP